MGKKLKAGTGTYTFTAAATGTHIAEVEASSLQEAIARSARAEWRLADECETGELVSVELPDGTVLEGAEIDEERGDG